MINGTQSALRQSTRRYVGVGFLAVIFGWFGTAASAEKQHSINACTQTLRSHANLTAPTSLPQVEEGWFSDTVKWVSPDIECTVTDSTVDYLRTGGQILVIEGFSGAEARAASERMRKELEATSQGLIDTFMQASEKLDSTYFKQLRQPNPDVDAILKKFEQEMAMLSGSYYRDFYRDNADRIGTLDAIEAATGKPLKDGEQDAQSIALAQQIGELNEVIKAHEADNQRLEAEVEAEKSLRSQQVADLQVKLAAAVDERDELKLKMFARTLPEHLSEMKSLLSEQQFSKAEDKLRWLRDNNVTDENFYNEIEALALKIVKGIPASSKDLNYAGYKFLLVLNPENQTYLAKIGEYSSRTAGMEPGTYWINDPQARHPDLYSCPSTRCGGVGELSDGSKVTVKEIKGSFARVSDYYRITCRNGEIIGDIDYGSTKCSPENGVKNGKIARWIDASYLTATEPKSVTASSDTEKLVAGSDDFGTYRTQFATAAEELVSSGQCSEGDFLSFGGWAASPEKGKGHYFIWCENLTVKHYLNAKTGQLD